jgi:glycosyltransferase involved in cell wall biosynthesis
MLAINGKIFTQPMSGLGRFAFEVIKQFIEHNLVFDILTPDKPLFPVYMELSPYIKRDTLAIEPLIWEITRLSYLASPKRYTALWSPANIGPLFPRVSHYLTLHDLTFLHLPEWMNPLSRFLYRFLIPKVCVKAEAIFCDTEFIKNEIASVYPFAMNKKIYRIYPGCDHINSDNAQIVTNIIKKESHFIFYGNIEKRKNVGNIVQAWLQAKSSLKDKATLFIVGSKKKREKYFPEFKDESIRVLNNIDDKGLIALLKQARGLIFPSLYEGFGFPIVEAMRCGCPVITSNLGSMAELATDAALLVDPYSVDDIAAAIVQLASSSHLYDSLKEQGCRREKLFRWNNTANFYKKILFP